jgi:hypothetical protein
MNAQLIQDYLQRATEKNNIRIYNCQCWIGSDSAKKDNFDVTIPFICKAEIGINVDVKRFQNQTENVIIDKYNRDISRKKVSVKDATSEGGSTELKWCEVLQDKVFSRQPNVGVTPELSVIYTKAGIDGSAEETITSATTTYGCLSITNMLDSSLTERVSSANATREGLELYQLYVSNQS